MREQSTKNQGGKTGGLTGGLWEVYGRSMGGLTGGLEIHYKLIIRCLTKNTGGLRKNHKIPVPISRNGKIFGVKDNQ